MCVSVSHGKDVRVLSPPSLRPQAEYETKLSKAREAVPQSAVEAEEALLAGVDKLCKVRPPSYLHICVRRLHVYVFHFHVMFPPQTNTAGRALRGLGDGREGEGGDERADGAARGGGQGRGARGRKGKD